MSCITLQLRSASSVARLVVRRRLRVMLNNHYARRQRDRQADQDRAAPTNPESERGRAYDQGCRQHLHRRRPQDRAPIANQPHRVDLDADLEQEQHHADIRQQLELTPVGHITRRERRNDQAHDQVAEHRGQPQPPGQPARRHRQQEHEPDLEDCRRGFGRDRGGQHHRADPILGS